MSKTIVTFTEALEITGLSRNYLYKLTSQRVIPHSKPGGKLIYFEREALENWMRSGKVDSQDQIDQKVAIHELKRKK